MFINESKVKEELKEIKELLKLAHRNTYNFEGIAREEIKTASGKLNTLIKIIEWEK